MTATLICVLYLKCIETALGEEGRGTWDSPVKALHAVFTNPVHFLFGFGCALFLPSSLFISQQCQPSWWVFIRLNSWSTASTLNSRERDWNNEEGQGSSEQRGCFPGWGHHAVPDHVELSWGQKQRLLSDPPVYVTFCIPHLTFNGMHFHGPFQWRLPLISLAAGTWKAAEGFYCSIHTAGAASAHCFAPSPPHCSTQKFATALPTEKKTQRMTLAQRRFQSLSFRNMTNTLGHVLGTCRPTPPELGQHRAPTGVPST